MFPVSEYIAIGLRSRGGLLRFLCHAHPQPKTNPLARMIQRTVAVPKSRCLNSRRSPEPCPEAFETYRKFSTSFSSDRTASYSANSSDRPSGETENPHAGSRASCATIVFLPLEKLRNRMEYGRKFGMK